MKSLYDMIEQNEKRNFENMIKIRSLEEENNKLKLALVESEEARLKNELQSKIAIAELAESLLEV